MIVPKKWTGLMERRLTTGEVSIRSCCGLEGLRSLREPWDALVSAMPRRQFVHRWVWYHNYLKFLEPAPDRVRFFLFMQGVEPVAILPLRQESLSFRGLRLKALAIPTHDHVPVCDILCSEEALSLPLLPILAAHLRGRGERWDVIHLPRLFEDANALAWIRKSPPPAFRFCQEGNYDCVDVAGSYDQLGLSRKARYNLRRTRQLLEQLPEVQFVFAKSGFELEDQLNSFLAVEASGWKGSEGASTAIQLQPHLVSFYRGLLDDFSASGQVAIHSLHAEGRCIASQFCLLSDDTLYMLKIGYDETYRRYAPGKQLVDGLIRHCTENPAIRGINFVAKRDWHADWNPKTMGFTRIDIFNDSLKGRIAFGALRLYQSLKPFFRSDRTGAGRPPDTAL